MNIMRTILAKCDVCTYHIGTQPTLNGILDRTVPRWMMPPVCHVCMLLLHTGYYVILKATFFAELRVYEEMDFIGLLAENPPFVHQLYRCSNNDFYSEEVSC